MGNEVGRDGWRGCWSWRLQEKDGSTMEHSSWPNVRWHDVYYVARGD